MSNSDDDMPCYDSPSESGEEQQQQVEVQEKLMDELISRDISPNIDITPTTATNNEAIPDTNATASNNNQDAKTTATTKHLQKVSNRTTDSYSNSDSYSASSSDSESDEGYAYRKRGQLKKAFRHEKRALFHLKKKLVETERLLTLEVSYHSLTTNIHSFVET
jgi:hypothetical protein